MNIVAYYNNALAVPNLVTSIYNRTTVSEFPPIMVCIRILRTTIPDYEGMSSGKCG